MRKIIWFCTAFLVIICTIYTNTAWSLGDYINTADNTTVIDNGTGLEWQKSDDDNTYSWQTALAYCEGLELNNQSDWRLPNTRELNSIVDDATSFPSINGTYFIGTADEHYWTATSYNHLPGEAWAVGFDLGDSHGATKDSSFFVRCVRSSFNLSVSIEGTGGGSVTSNPDGINCNGDCSESYPAGTVVTLTAVPVVADSVFTGWSGNCSGANQVTEVIVDAAKTCTATFSLNNYTINASVSEGQGSISPNEKTVTHGETTTFEIMAAPGHSIDTVEGCGGTWTGSNPFTTSAITENCSVTAGFSPTNSYVITARAGNGGSIDPEGEIFVNHGANQTFTFTADPGYQVDRVDICGDISEDSTLSSHTYFNVTRTHYITVFYALTSTGDIDEDGIVNSSDNCPRVTNTDQKDLDNDGKGNVCDDDDDNDGMYDEWESAYNLDPKDSRDRDVDSDHDGFSNIQEFNYKTNPLVFDEDLNEDGIPDIVVQRGKLLAPINYLLLN